MLSITAVLRYHEFRFLIGLGAQGGSQISTGRENFACSTTVLPTLCEGFVIELYDFEAANAMLKGDYLWQVVEIVIGGVPILLEVGCICLFMSLSRILL